MWGNSLIYFVNEFVFYEKSAKLSNSMDLQLLSEGLLEASRDGIVEQLENNNFS